MWKVHPVWSQTPGRWSHSWTRPIPSTTNTTSPGWIFAFLLNEIPGHDSSQWHAENKRASSAGGRGSSALGEKPYLLFVLLHGYASVARLLFSLGLFDGHSLVYPFIGRFQVGCAGCRIIALQIGSLAIQQIHVRHGIVVVRPQLERLFQHRDAILNNVLDLLPKRVADFLIFQRLLWLQSQLRALFHAGLVRLGPVDHTD